MKIKKKKVTTAEEMAAQKPKRKLGILEGKAVAVFMPDFK